MSGENLLPGLWPFSHGALSEGKGEEAIWGLYSKGTKPIHKDSVLMI